MEWWDSLWIETGSSRDIESRWMMPRSVLSPQPKGKISSLQYLETQADILLHPATVSWLELGARGRLAPGLGPEREHVGFLG